jgi:hypothetical protein
VPHDSDASSHRASSAFMMAFWEPSGAVTLHAHVAMVTIVADAAASTPTSHNSLGVQTLVGQGTALGPPWQT